MEINFPFEVLITEIKRGNPPGVAKIGVSPNVTPMRRRRPRESTEWMTLAKIQR